MRAGAEQDGGWQAASTSCGSLQAELVFIGRQGMARAVVCVFWARGSRDCLPPHPGDTFLDAGDAGAVRSPAGRVSATTGPRSSWSAPRARPALSASEDPELTPAATAASTTWVVGPPGIAAPGPQPLCSKQLQRPADQHHHHTVLPGSPLLLTGGSSNRCSHGNQMLRSERKGWAPSGCTE